MTRAKPGATAGPRLGHAVLATAWMLGLPALTAAAYLALTSPDPPVYLSGGLTLGASLAAGALGARRWRRAPESRAAGFSELMLWTWARRLRHQQRIDQGGRLLDLDAALFTDQPWIARPPDQLKTLTRLAAALERKDLYTHGHSRRVSRHSCRTALELGITLDDIEELGQAAALHDVGKIQVPDEVLRKAGPLTIEERLRVQEHAEIGAQLVSTLGSDRIAGAVLHHHERWDGGGYPRGLAREAIPLFARVIAVADSFDAMTSTRPYRDGMSRDQALDALRQGAGGQFDPAVVDAFERSLPALVSVPVLLPLAATLRRLARGGAEWASRTGAATIAPATGSVTAAAMAATLVVSAPSASMGVPRIPEPAPNSAVAAVELSAAATAGGQESATRRPHRAHSAPTSLLSRRRAEVSPGGSASAPDSEEPDKFREKSSELPLAAVGDPARDEKREAPARGADRGGPDDSRPQPELPPSSEEPGDNQGTIGQAGRADDGNNYRGTPAKKRANKPTGDPQPDHGRDCDGRPGKGRGRAKHCG
jgi:HD domain